MKIDLFGLGDPRVLSPAPRGNWTKKFINGPGEDRWGHAFFGWDGEHCIIVQAMSMQSGHVHVVVTSSMVDSYITVTQRAFRLKKWDLTPVSDWVVLVLNKLMDDATDPQHEPVPDINDATGQAARLFNELEYK